MAFTCNDIAGMIDHPLFNHTITADAMAKGIDLALLRPAAARHAIEWT